MLLTLPNDGVNTPQSASFPEAMLACWVSAPDEIADETTQAVVLALQSFNASLLVADQASDTVKSFVEDVSDAEGKSSPGL